MKLKKLLTILLVLLFSVSVVVGCGGGGGGGGGGKTVTSTANISWIPLDASLTYPESENFVWSTDSEDFMNHTHKAILLGPDFKISVDTQSMSEIGDYPGFKERRSETYDIHDVEFGGLEGLAYHRGVSYDIFLVIPYESLGIPERTGLMWLQVYANDSEDKAVLATKFNSNEVQNILKTVKLSKVQ
jgi:hypothetical protein